MSPLTTRAATASGKVATTDSNLDGRADAYVANNGSGSVGLLVGNGTGGFLLPSTRSIEIRPVGGRGRRQSTATASAIASSRTTATRRSPSCAATAAAARSGGEELLGRRGIRYRASRGSRRRLRSRPVDRMLRIGELLPLLQPGRNVRFGPLVPAKFAVVLLEPRRFDRDGDAERASSTDELSDEAYGLHAGRAGARFRPASELRGCPANRQLSHCAPDSAPLARTPNRSEAMST